MNDIVWNQGEEGVWTELNNVMLCVSELIVSLTSEKGFSYYCYRKGDKASIRGESRTLEEAKDAAITLALAWDASWDDIRQWWEGLRPGDKFELKGEFYIRTNSVLGNDNAPVVNVNTGVAVWHFSELGDDRIFPLIRKARVECRVI